MFQPTLEGILAVFHKAEKQLVQYVDKCAKDQEANTDLIRKINDSTAEIKVQEGRAVKALAAVRNIIA